jgi:mRNA-degrading endonuclease RelE of RelBE toxin-antitoxin system
MLRVVADKNFRAALARLPPEQQAEVLAALRELPAAFGRPHVHAGLGLRQLRPGIFEVRVGLQIGALFERDDDLLVVKIVGDHDAIRRYLRSRA